MKRLQVSIRNRYKAFLVSMPVIGFVIGWFIRKSTVVNDDYDVKRFVTLAEEMLDIGNSILLPFLMFLIVYVLVAKALFKGDVNVYRRAVPHGLTLIMFGVGLYIVGFVVIGSPLFGKNPII